MYYNLTVIDARFGGVAQLVSLWPYGAIGPEGALLYPLHNITQQSPIILILYV